MPRNTRSTGKSRLVLFNVKLPAYLYNAMYETVKRGVATNVSEFVRYAVSVLLAQGTYPAPPPFRKPIVHISFHLTEWAVLQLEELVARGVYASVAEAIRAAIYHVLGRPTAVETAPIATPRRGVREETKKEPEAAEEDGSAWKPNGSVIIPAKELRITEEEWYKAAPCITTLIIRETWEKYYIVDVECAKRRGVEV